MVALASVKDLRMFWEKQSGSGGTGVQLLQPKDSTPRYKSLWCEKSTFPTLMGKLALECPGGEPE